MKKNKHFGLIGKDIEYSFSRKYFSNKFSSSHKFSGYDYKNYDIQSLDQIKTLFKNNFDGLNVTIPYKEKIIKYLDSLTNEAKEIGAVNTICFENGKKIGYNTDLFGFSESLKINNINNIDNVLILGTGGAAKMIKFFCKKNKISFNIVSRQKSHNYLSYADINCNSFSNNSLIVNCSPVGTYPNINQCPEIPYECLNKENILFDLVYNPSETLFMKKGNEIGCKTLNGLDMLRFQAEMSWKLWTNSTK